METTVIAAKAEFTRAKERIARALATTPEDRINWSPASSARTPLQQVAHSAMATTGIRDMILGEPFPYADIAEADAAWRAAEKEFNCREQALGLLEQSSAEYLAWLDTLTADQLASTLQLPFGTFPMAAAITFAADHLRNHAAQIDYIQTLYGDQDWHLQA
jgi:hypothetical protein